MKTPARDPAVPLCFDTNALRGFSEAIPFLRRCRSTWHHRMLIIPSVVVAEQVRHWMATKTKTFDPTRFNSFLENYTVVGFDCAVVLSSWLDVLVGLHPRSPAPWPWRYDEPPARLNRDTWEPCADVCRWPDHAIQAIARHHRALLVTEDTALRATMTSYRPGTVNKRDIEAQLR